MSSTLKLSQLTLGSMDLPITARLKMALKAHPTIRSAADLAREAEVTPATVSNWLGNKIQEEQGKGIIGVKLSRALGIRVEWLFTGEGPMRANDVAPPTGQTSTLDADMIMEAYRVLRQIYGVSQTEKPHLIENKDVAARFVQLYSMRESILSNRSQGGGADGSRIRTTDERPGVQTNGRNDGVPAHGTRTKKMAGRVGHKTKA